MEIVSSENDNDGLAIRALGSLFKLTEVSLWDDNSTEARRRSSFPKHIRFNYDDDDEEEVVVEDDGIINPRSFETLDDRTLGEDVELNQQMSELGLPLSFQSSKEGAGIAKGKRKGKHKKNPQNQKRIQDEVPVGSSKVSAEDNLPDAVDESSNSSSLSLPCQSEPSSSFHCTADFSSFAQSSSIEEKQEDTAAAKSSFSSQEQQHLSDDVSHGGTSDMSGEVSILYGLEATHFVSESDMMPATDLLTLDASSSGGVVADGGSIDKDQKEIDGKVKKHAGIEASSSESGNYDMACEEELCSTITSEQPQASDSAEHSSKVVDCEGMDSYECCGSSGDWGAFWDPFCMRYYFYNVQSQESTWDPPPGMENFAFCNASNCTNAEMAGMESVGPENTLCETISCETGCRGCNEGEVAHMFEASDLNNAEDCDKMFFNQMHPDSIETIDGDDLKIVNPPPTNKKKKKNRRRRIKNKSFLGTDEQMQFQDIIVEEAYVDISKYWCQRYLLFSKFDHGIQLDDEGWFSVTPETIARHQASRCVGDTVIDCFAGVGGNAIQFAIANKHVTAIDIDPKKIDYARSNANIYGVEDQIDFIRGDAFLLARKLKADMVFLSPPWGGPDYLKVETYDMNMLKPHDGQYLFGVFREVASRIVLFLPRNVDVNQLAEIALSVDPPWSLEVEKNFLNGKFKAVTAYFSRSLL